MHVKVGGGRALDLGMVGADGGGHRLVLINGTESGLYCNFVTRRPAVLATQFQARPFLKTK